MTVGSANTAAKIAALEEYYQPAPRGYCTRFHRGHGGDGEGELYYLFGYSLCLCL